MFRTAHIFCANKKGVVSQQHLLCFEVRQNLVVNKRKRPTPHTGREQFTLFSLHEIWRFRNRD